MWTYKGERENLRTVVVHLYGLDQTISLPFCTSSRLDWIGSRRISSVGVRLDGRLTSVYSHGSTLVDSDRSRLDGSFGNLNTLYYLTMTKFDTSKPYQMICCNNPIIYHESYFCKRCHVIFYSWKRYVRFSHSVNVSQRCISTIWHNVSWNLLRQEVSPFFRYFKKIDIFMTDIVKQCPLSKDE